MNSRSIYSLLFGVVVLALFMIWAVPFYSSRIPAVLSGYVKDQVQQAGHQWPQLSTEGRDLTLSGKAPTARAHHEVVDIATNAPGIRSVTDKITPRIISPYTFTATWKDKQLTSSGFLPDEGSLMQTEKQLHRLFGENSQSQLQVGSGNPAGWEPLTNVLIEILPVFEQATIDLVDKNLDMSGKINTTSQQKQLMALLAPYREQGYNLSINIVAADAIAMRCQQQFDVLLKQTIAFSSGNNKINSSSFTLLGNLADTAMFCPKELITIEGHTDNRGDTTRNQQLSQQRAQAVAEWLIKAGVDEKRLRTVGYGSEKPVADNETEAGRARNRRIEFKVGGQ